MNELASSSGAGQPRLRRHWILLRLHFLPAPEIVPPEVGRWGSRGIAVNNIQPGPIDTDLNPAAGDWAAPQKANTALDRYGSVDEVAALVAFVAGPEASYITGANLTVDGGTNA